MHDNHAATQSTFASPCIPAHDTNITINGFDSGFRDTVNGTAITNLVVPITDNSTIWFFDVNTCARGGVGGINVNDSSTETLDGFRVSPSVSKLYGSCSLGALSTRAHYPSACTMRADASLLTHSVMLFA